MRIRQNMRIQGKEVKRVENSIAMKKETDKEYLNLPIISAGEYAEELSVYTDKDGNKAVVPPRWTVSGIKEENIIWGNNLGLVIYNIPKEKIRDINWTDPDDVDRLERTYDQFVWTPVSLLEANGTLDGVFFNEQFGRRNYREDVFSENEFHEELDGELLLQKESIDKYKGYYSTRYDISMDPKTKRPRSIKGLMPLLVGADFPASRRVAKDLVRGETVNTHLMYGAEYDTQLEWVIETGTKTLHEVAKDSTSWGNYYDKWYSQHKLVKTGSRKEWRVNNIYDLAGNVEKMTQEKYGIDGSVTRGGCCKIFNISWTPVAFRFFFNDNYINIGFRATLYIK